MGVTAVGALLQLWAGGCDFEKQAKEEETLLPVQHNETQQSTNRHCPLR